MNQEVAKKWVDALRSGKYQQARTMLRGGDRFCCLGVLCDVSGKGKWHFGSYITDDGRKASSYLLSEEMLEALGITDSEQMKYAAMNDDALASFADIASQIEKDAGLTAENSPSNTSENPSVSLGGKKE